MSSHCFLLSPVVSFVQSARIRSFHYHMYHGHGTRDGIIWPDVTWAFLGNSLRTPLLIVRPGNRIPSICRPIGGQSLVVADELAHRLRTVQRVELQKVVYAKLVDQEWAEGDFSWYELPHGTDPGDYLEALQDVPRMHETVKASFEVIVARLQDVQRYPPSEGATMVTVGELLKAEVKLSDATFRSFPIIWCPAGWLLSPTACRLFEPYVDRDYFDVVRVEY